MRIDDIGEHIDGGRTRNCRFAGTRATEGHRNDDPTLFGIHGHPTTGGADRRILNPGRHRVLQDVQRHRDAIGRTLPDGESAGEAVNGGIVIGQHGEVARGVGGRGGVQHFRGHCIIEQVDRKRAPDGRPILPTATRRHSQ